MRTDGGSSGNSIAHVDVTPGRGGNPVAARVLYGPAVADNEILPQGSWPTLSEGPLLPSLGIEWTPDYSRSDVTRFIPVVPGGAGPLVHADDDGIVDVEMTDRNGAPAFWFRAREASGDTGEVVAGLRGTGMLDPLGMEGTPFLRFRSWCELAMERDYLAGRIGRAGWNGEDHDLGLQISKDYVEPSMLEWWNWNTYALVIGGVAVGVVMLLTGAGAVMLAGAGVAALTGGAVTAGTASLIIGGALVAGFGTYAAISRHNEGQTFWQSVGGGLADVTGATTLTAGLFNVDIATGRYLGLSSEERAFKLGMGAVQLGATAYGGYRLGRWGVGKFRDWRASPGEKPLVVGTVRPANQAKANRILGYDDHHLNPPLGRIDPDYRIGPTIPVRNDNAGGRVAGGVNAHTGKGGFQVAFRSYIRDLGYSVKEWKALPDETRQVFVRRYYASLGIPYTR